MLIPCALRQLINFGFSFALFYATKKGLGLHDVDIPVAERASLSRANYAFTVLYVSVPIRVLRTSATMTFAHCRASTRTRP
jgi:hypothetical protein